MKFWSIAFRASDAYPWFDLWVSFRGPWTVILDWLCWRGQFEWRIRNNWSWHLEADRLFDKEKGTTSSSLRLFWQRECFLTLIGDCFAHVNDKQGGKEKDGKRKQRRVFKRAAKTGAPWLIRSQKSTKWQKSFPVSLSVSIIFNSFQAIKKCRDITFAYLAEHMEMRRGTQHLMNSCGVQGSVFWKTWKVKFTLGKELQQLAPKESYEALRYQLPLLRKWDCLEFALERPCYFYLNLLLCQKYVIIIVSSLLFHIGFCWLIWTDKYRYARVFLAWYWNFWIETIFM